MSKGFIKLWRQIDDSAIAKHSPLHYRVWCWLLTHASHKHTVVEGIDLEAGELATTYRRIATSITWEENRSPVVPSSRQLRTVMSNLERLEMVQIENRTKTGTKTGTATGLDAGLRQGYLHIKVLHWTDYQGQSTTTATGLNEELRQEQRQEQRQHIKEVRKKEPKTLAHSAPQNGSGSSEFIAFWAMYPRKKSKGQAAKAFTAARKKATTEEIMAGLEQQLPDLKSRESQFVPYPATWLNGEQWADEAPVKKLTPMQQMMLNAGLEVKDR